MKITPGELAANGFVLLDQFNHQEALAFVREYSKRNNRYTLAYKACNLFIIALLGYWFWYNHRYNLVSFNQGISSMCLGFAFLVPLIPIHEWIHGVAYKAVGAVTTSYHMNLRKFYFFALADQFVAGWREFRLVALAPFVIISVLLIALMLLSTNEWTFAFLGALLMHTACCTGDFALLSYFLEHADQEVVTYDDKKTGTSYFYGRAR